MVNKAIKPGSRPARNQLRIIGGKWRGRKIHFPDLENLRPTPDRVRETLFNWLAGWIEGATCVDLFAGSGALGFEAASRGAAKVVLVDQARPAVTALKQSCQTLRAEEISVLHLSAQQALAQLPATNILFLDPPFQRFCLDELLEQVEAGNFLKPGAWIYVESSKDRAIVTPSHWHLQREKVAGQVAYRLFRQQELEACVK